MQSTSIMQEIKGLLEQGKRSGELIRMGFAPGTVYKVQRQFRRSASKGRTQKAESSQLKKAPEDDVVTLARELGHCQEQRESLQIEMQHLKAAEEEANRLRLRDLQLAGELRSMRAELVETESKVARLKEENRTLTQENERLGSEIQNARMENINLRGYLRSKNCQWERDFALYRHQPDHGKVAICTYQHSTSCLPWLRLQPCQYQAGKEVSKHNGG